MVYYHIARSQIYSNLWPYTSILIIKIWRKDWLLVGRITSSYWKFCVWDVKRYRQHHQSHAKQPKICGHFLPWCREIKLVPYVDVISTTHNADIHLSLNGSLASTVGSIQGRGRPKMFVSKVQLESLFELGFTYAKVAKMLCISERTLQRRRSELGFPVGRAMLY